MLLNIATIRQPYHKTHIQFHLETVVVDLLRRMCYFNFKEMTYHWKRKGPGTRGHIVAHDFSWLRKMGNICCGHKMFLNKIRNISCVPDTKFVSATDKCCACGQTEKHMCRQQCVRNNVSLFAGALSLLSDLRI